MPHLPARFAGIILAFAPLFVHRTWRHARVLLIGAILAPGRRTVASVLRITGHSTMAAWRHGGMAAWYRNLRPTFSDALAAARRAVSRQPDWRRGTARP